MVISETGSLKKKFQKRRWCLNCGHRISIDDIALAYASGAMLRCTKCDRLTTAIAVDEVAGNFIEVFNGDKSEFVEEVPKEPVWEREL